ncbi:PLP-dependent aminotransferase family protein [Nocardia huaxiensis]|uniref:PLP-dependent aminotransferase family protein n=1 Tax=Nocardia huaxiensis TaxID=2755382 RepID=A0A7D6VEC7_9NOCA|nr:PLP-dependent aminotransferase family protein [Nocardia huaxiensis]QLY32462.1 PLP-dependent aminotransferase family protein [Nocardia huaxiensis]UFS93831.1 PLP-dependent aminotransferase family protein [Nocardia huaxiensis]
MGDLAAEDLPFTVDRASAVPLAVQVADGLRGAAATGAFRGGDRLPSSRELAARLRVSRTVVTAAYDQLHAEGWLSGRHGSGTYLTASPEPAAAPASGAYRTNPLAGLLDLGAGAPSIETLDRAAWRRAWRAASDRIPLVRRDRAGEADYLAAVAEHLLRHRGLVPGSGCTVLATSGTSSAVAELAAALLKPGDTAAIEDPGYSRAAGAFRAAGVRLVPVPVDADGLRVDLLPENAKAVYCTPAHQFPLGARMPAARRVALIEFARRTGALILEDDYDGELRYDTAPLPLLATLAPDVVVHLGTTSKILTPTLGCGWMVAAPGVADAVLTHRELTGTSAAPAGQQVVAALARHGDLARHLRRLRREMPPRRALVVNTLRERGLEVRGDDAGSHVAVILPSQAEEDRAIAAARTAGVYLDGLGRHHIGPRHTFGIALGYAALPRHDLPHAVRLAADALASA